MRARPLVRVIVRCLSEAVKNLWEAMSVICIACVDMPTIHVYNTRAVFFHLFPKIKRCMAAVSSVATSLRVYVLRTYSAVILVLARPMNSLKMKQMVVFCFLLQQSSGCVLK